MNCYSRLLAHYPYVVVLVVALVSVTCLVIAFSARSLPQFDDPSVGFETRHTTISNRLITYQNLIDATGNTNNDLLSVIPPKLIHDTFTARSHEINKTTWWPKRSRRSADGNHTSFLCDGSPGVQYSRIVVQGVSGSEDLFSLDPLLSMCQFDLFLRSLPTFANVCILATNDECCPSWTLANYVAAYSGKSSCIDIDNTDVSSLKSLVISCAEYYHNGSLDADCYQNGCSGVPRSCSIAFEVLHYVTDIYFLDTISAVEQLTYAVMYLPMVTGSGVKDFYKSIPSEALHHDLLSTVAMHFGLKYELFQEYLKLDTVYLGLASGSVVVLMWLYTRSLFITLMMTLSMLFSIVIAYFFYSMIFEFVFFPFINLLAIILVVAVGADDVFIYVKVWACAKGQKDNGLLDKVISDTLNHAALSMFVSSLTTAAALYGSYVSNITALKCFSIFAGTAVLINFFFMVTWLPACIVIHDKWCATFSVCCHFASYTSKDHICYYLMLVAKPFHSLQKCLHQYSKHVFDKFLPYIVIKLRFLWLSTFIGLAACGCIAVFYRPKLSLPDVDYFQCFQSVNPLELYDVKFRDMFWFEKTEENKIKWGLPIRIIFGIEATDNGDHLNPYSIGTLSLDKSFDIMAPESQKWILNFCTHLRNQSFFKPTIGPHLTDCFLENFTKWMHRPCIAPDGSDNGNCCRKSTFPFSKSVFDECLLHYMTVLQITPTYRPSRSVAGPRFLMKTGDVQAMILEFESKYSFSYKYLLMNSFYEDVESWVSEQLKNAPTGLKNGFFISTLDFYDLQHNLSRGTLTAIAVALAVAFLVLFITTLNVLISVYAIFVITCIIFISIGTLTALGWKLNVLESSTVTVAVGLAVDLTLHYCVAYRCCTDKDDRRACVKFSLSRIGSPVALAAFTTFVAGIFLLPANVLGYKQLGLFLIIIMAASWLFATFLFQSILVLAGPENDFLQFYWPKLECCSTPPRHIDKTVYHAAAFSESTLSSSSCALGGNPSHVTTLSSESHELEPLNVSKRSLSPHYHYHHHHHHHHHHHYHHRYKPRYSGVVLHHKETSASSSVPTSSTLLFADEERELSTSPYSKEEEVEDVWLRRSSDVLNVLQADPLV